MWTSCWRSGAGQGGLPHAHAGEGLAGGLGAGVGQVDGGAGTANAACAGGQVVDGVVQLGAGAQVGGQGGVHGADTLGEPAPPGQVNDRVGDGRGVGAGCVEQVAQAGAAMALKQCCARPGLTEAEALHSPGEAAHQGQPEPHGGRWAEQDDVAAGLGHRGPDEGHVPQVRPGLRPLLGRHVGPRGDAGESRAREQTGCPGHDRIGGEEQR